MANTTWLGQPGAKVAVTVVITMLVTAFMTFLITRFNAGGDAIQNQAIKAVIREELLMPDGRSFNAALVKMESDVAVIKGKLVILAEN